MWIMNAWRRARDRTRPEHGAVNVVLVGALVIVMTVAVAVIVPIGHSIAERRSATTAADAAALAGADYCADRLEDAYADAVSASDGWQFWAQFGKPVSFYCSGASLEAQQFASANDADLTGFHMLSGLRFRADASRRTQVEQVGVHMSSRATARMEMRTGACVSGGLLGVRSGLSCETVPTMFNPETGEPLRPLIYSPFARIDTELVVS